MGLMTDYHQFIITTMDMHTIDLEPYQYSGTNITGIRLVDPENPLMEQLTNFMAESERESERDIAEGESEVTGNYFVASKSSLKSLQSYFPRILKLGLQKR